MSSADDSGFVSVRYAKVGQHGVIFPRWISAAMTEEKTEEDYVDVGCTLVYTVYFDAARGWCGNCLGGAKTLVRYLLDDWRNFTDEPIIRSGM